MKTIVKYVMKEVLRSKVIFGFSLFLMAITVGLFSLEDSTTKATLSLLNVVLILVPLVSIVFSTMFVYNTSEFIELLVTQPIARGVLWRSLYAGVGLAMLAAVGVGLVLPLLIFNWSTSAMMLGVMSLALVLIFSGIGMRIAIKRADRAKGIGTAIFTWLFFAVLYDALVLFIAFQWSDYPIEKPMVMLIALNPIDLARTLMVMQLDVSAMMGYTGAVFLDYSGNTWGMLIIALLFILWMYLPFRRGLRDFVSRDF
jgi:Cu-processing system permease protein